MYARDRGERVISEAAMSRNNAAAPSRTRGRRQEKFEDRLARWSGTAKSEQDT